MAHENRRLRSRLSHWLAGQLKADYSSLESSGPQLLHMGGKNKVSCSARCFGSYKRKANIITT